MLKGSMFDLALAELQASFNKAAVRLSQAHQADLELAQFASGNSTGSGLGRAEGARPASPPLPLCATRHPPRARVEEEGVALRVRSREGVKSNRSAGEFPSHSAVALAPRRHVISLDGPEERPMCHKSVEYRRSSMNGDANPPILGIEVRANNAVSEFPNGNHNLSEAPSEPANHLSLAELGSPRSSEWGANNVSLSKGPSREGSFFGAWQNSRPGTGELIDGDAVGPTASMDRKSIAIHPIWQQSKKQYRKRSALIGSGSTADQSNTQGSEYSTRKKLEGYRRASNSLLRASFGSEFVSEEQIKKRCTAAQAVWNPQSWSRVLWDITGMVIILYDLLLLPVQVYEPPANGFFESASLITLLFWTVDIPLSFMTGYLVRGLVEYRLTKVALHYIKSWFLFDAFVVSTDWVVTYHDSFSGLSTSQLKAGKAIRLLRMMRLMRLLKFQGILKDLANQIRSEATQIILGIVKLLFFIMCVNHVIACCWFGIGKLSKALGESRNWIEFHGLSDSPIIYQYLTSLHWSWTQFTPASMEVYPVNSWERMYTVMTLLFAMVSFSSFVSSITNAMTRLRNMHAERDHQHTLLREYMMENDCSVKLASRIWAFIDALEKDNKKRRKREKDVPLLAKLPDDLRVELADETYLPTLGRHPFFKSFSIKFPAELHRFYKVALEESSLSMGRDLFSEGVAATHMYFVLGGQVDYLPMDSVQDVTVLPGQWLSEAAMWLQWHHAGRAVSAVRSNLIAVNVAKFQHLVQNELKGVCEPSYYAIAFYAYFAQEDPEEVLSDVFCDLAVLGEFAQTSFGLDTHGRESAVI